MDDARRSLWALVGAISSQPRCGNNQCVQKNKATCMRRHRNYSGTTKNYTGCTDVRQAALSGHWGTCMGNLYDRATVLRAIFTRWPTTTIEQRWCFCWGGSGVRSRSRRQSAGARPEGYCTELFEELVERDSFRELHVQ